LKNKLSVLITLMLGTSMAAIDSSIVNVSLPIIRKEFNAELSGVEWVITAYMISFCLFIPLTNWLKKRIGYFNLFIGAVIIFTIGSLLCSISTSLNMLVIARVVQAIGGGAISPTSLAILSENYPPEQRGSAIGWWGIGNVMGPAIGPTLGGLLTHYFGWESIFYVNVPIGILVIFMTMRHLGFLKAQSRFHTKFDVVGYVYFAVFVVAIQFTVSAISDYGFPSWQLPAGVAATCTALYLFIRSAKKPDSLLDLSVFKLAVFNKAAIVIVIRSLALYGGMFFLPFLLQGLLGYSAFQSGLILLPNALMMLVSRPFAGRMADRGKIRNTSITGIIIVACSFILFSQIDVGASLLAIILPMVIRGLGMSLLVSPVSTALLNAVSIEQTATATSMNSLLQQFGGSIGIAVSGVIHAFIYNYYLNNKYGETISEHFALQDSFLLSGFVILLAIIPALKLPQKPVVKIQKTVAS